MANTASAVELTLRRLANELPRYGYRFGSEKELHDGIAHVLTQIGLPFRHEHTATEKDRFDFLLENGVVIEAKIGGSMSDAATQVDRYCALDSVVGVAIVTNQAWGRRVRKALVMRGKPVKAIVIRRNAF